MKPFLSVFLRVNNRKKSHTHADLDKAGYPMVMFSLNGGRWSAAHKLCQEIFKDPQGRSTYIWFGSRFYFLTKDDAMAFRTILLIA